MQVDVFRGQSNIGMKVKILLKKSGDRTDQYISYYKTLFFFMIRFFYYKVLKFEIALFLFDLLTFVVQ